MNLLPQANACIDEVYDFHVATYWHLRCAGVAETSWCWCVTQPAETCTSLGGVNEGYLSAGNLCICLGCWTRLLCRVCWLPEQHLTHCLKLLPNNIGLKVFDYFEVEVSVKQTYSLQVKGVCDFRVVWVLKRNTYWRTCKCWFLIFAWVYVPNFMFKLRDCLYAYLVFLKVQALRYLTRSRILCTLLCCVFQKVRWWITNKAN